MRDIDCAEARRLLEEIRRNRRSQSPSDLRRAAVTLGYTIDGSRRKGSHWWARKPDSPRFPIPTTRDPVSVGVTTRILNYLEEVFDDVCQH
jgi:hypothetical protein